MNADVDGIRLFTNDAVEFLQKVPGREPCVLSRCLLTQVKM